MDEMIIIINADGTTREMPLEQYEAYIQAKLNDVISSEGRIIAKVISANPYLNEETGRETIIVGFNKVSEDMVQAIVDADAEENYAKALNIGLSCNVPTNATFIPQKGEMVQVSVGFVESREKTQVLRVIGLPTPLPKAASKKLDFAALRGKSKPSSEPDFDVTTANKDALLAKAQEMGINVAPHMTSAGAIKTTAVETVRALVAAKL